MKTNRKYCHHCGSVLKTENTHYKKTKGYYKCETCKIQYKYRKILIQTTTE